MKRLVTVTGPVAAAQMDGYLIEERLLDHIMIQVIDKGDGNLEIAFHERDQRYLSQFSAAQLAEWLQEAMLHVEAACPLETRDGKVAWITDEAHRKPDHQSRPCDRHGRTTNFRLAWSS
jgi:hypothetical protein